MLQNDGQHATRSLVHGRRAVPGAYQGVDLVDEDDGSSQLVAGIKYLVAAKTQHREDGHAEATHS
jgi:hypothetical protein